MDVLKLLRGSHLVRRGVDGVEVPVDSDTLDIGHRKAGDGSLETPTGDRYIGLYFASGQSDFTSELRCFYDHINGPSAGSIRRCLEIVYVSPPYADNKHLADMPWLALSSGDCVTAKNLMRVIRVDVDKYGAMLVVVDAITGRIVSRNYRSRFVNDPQGTGFPWSPVSLGSLIGGRLVDASGAVHDLDEAVQYSLLYFSANWCPPCKAFTPQLAKTTENLANRAVSFLVIFVSFDRSRESFEQYFGGMPAAWLAVPYEDEARRRELAEHLLVQGIPRLIILDKNNRVVCRDGRHEVAEDVEGKNFPWAPQSVELLTTKCSSRLNENPFIVLFTDGNDEELEQARAILWPIAEELASRDNVLHLNFFVAGEGDPGDSLRDFAQLEDVVPLVVIMDTLVGEKYVLNDFDDEEKKDDGGCGGGDGDGHDDNDDDEVELSTDVIRRFVWRFLDGSLEATPIFRCDALTTRQ